MNHPPHPPDWGAPPAPYVPKAKLPRELIGCGVLLALGALVVVLGVAGRAVDGGADASAPHQRARPRADIATTVVAFSAETRKDWNGTKARYAGRRVLISGTLATLGNDIAVLTGGGTRHAPKVERASVTMRSGEPLKPLGREAAANCAVTDKLSLHDCFWDG